MVDVANPLARHLLGLLEEGFPFAPAPFEVLGNSVGMDADEVMKYVVGMKEAGLIRQIGPVYAPKPLGYKTTLVGVRVTDIESAAERLVGCKGVSHAYEREYDINLWFTLAVPEGSSISGVVAGLLGSDVAEGATVLPAGRTFKLQSGFASLNRRASRAEALPHPAYPLVLSEQEKRVINGLPYDLPLALRPFDKLASKMGISVETLLQTCQGLVKRGVMKRYSGAVNHVKLGLEANAMACWSVPEKFVSVVARELVQFNEVSHCYERDTMPGWHFNLFAMIHASNRPFCFDIIEQVCRSTGQDDKVVLFSRRELIKRRTEYLV